MALRPRYPHLYPFSGKPNLSLVQQNLRVYFLKSELLRIALTHSSYLNEHPDENLECNERLEFLGDAVLDLAVADALYKKSDIDPITAWLRSVNVLDTQLQEGEMTLIRSKVVSGKTLARVARKFELGEHLLLGSGEEKNNGRDRDSNLAAAFEAIVGAIFVDKGYQPAREFCISKLEQEIKKAYDEVTSTPKQAAKSESVKKSKQPKKPNTAGKHPKSALQEIVQAKYGVTPEYRSDKPKGKSHQPTFTTKVYVKGKAIGTGSGSGKKAAETAAAKAALKSLQKNT